MGRKTCNKIIKDKNHENEKKKKEEDEEYLYLTEQNNKIRKEEKEYDNFNILWNTHKEMLSYCDDMSIPLCDYMSIDIFEEFIKYLEQQ
jgi:hypothetical protein